MGLLQSEDKGVTIQISVSVTRQPSGPAHTAFIPAENKVYLSHQKCKINDIIQISPTHAKKI